LGNVFHDLIRPGIRIPPSSIKIHGIVPDMVYNARQIDDVFDDFLSFIGVDILIAHNACFDLGFLNAVMKRKFAFPIQNLTLDTLLLCKEIAFPSHHMYPYGINLRSIEFSLDAIAKHYGIDLYHRHTALGDALAAGMIFQRVLTKAESQGRGKLKTLIKHGAI
jgi:DNA polymerase III epsilon subunit family exonuclease